MAVTTHRGPDGSGTYVTDSVSLGHNRLAIIDLSEKAAQPMISKDGRYVITYNGELYNYRELKRELKSSHQFSTESDTEVLLAAYALWGERMLPRLHGIFALAIWDTKEQSLLLVRDHMGVKPLYYASEGTDLVFSSELSALINQSRNNLDPRSLSLFLEMAFVPGPLTLIQGVKKLPAGHLLRWTAGRVEIEEYHPLFSGDDEETGSDLYQVIDSAVERQLVADRPLGIFLSGGLDSSIVLHHMSQHSPSIRSFSVDFEMVPGAETESDKFNTDAALAARTAEVYGAKHTTFSISIGDIRSSLETAYQMLDEPNANPTGLSQYLLSQWVRESGVVVALGGDGGDELFGGYTRHRAMMAAYLFQRLPDALQTLLHPLHPRFSKLSIPFQTPLHLSLMALEESLINGITKPNLSAMANCKTYFDTLYRTVPADMHPLEAFMWADRRTWLADESLLRTDRSSMAHGLELRVPLLDMDVVRLSHTISVYQKTSPWQGKKILRQVYRDHLPAYLFNQPKRGWISPGAKWLRDPVINAFVTEVFSSAYYDGLDQLFDWPALQRMLREHTAGDGYYRQPLWNVLALQIWAKKHNLVYCHD